MGNIDENEKIWIVGEDCQESHVDEESMANSDETDTMMSHAFAWDEHIWDPEYPEHTGLPVLIFVDSYRQDRDSIPLIMFYPWKTIIPNQDCRRRGIPMAICDDPYIPDRYKHRKHELTEEELNQIKAWVVKYKDVLLMDDAYIENELYEIRAFK